MTDEERKTIAEIFRRLSRKESLTAVELGPAVRYLVKLPGYPKTEKDVWDFFSHCATWFYKKEQTFAKASDGEVIRQVGNRFRPAIGAELMAGKPGTQACPECNGTGQDSEGRYVCQACWGEGAIPSSGAMSFSDLGPAPVEKVVFKGKTARVTSMSWKEEITPTQYAEARERTEAGQELSTWQRFLRKIRWMPFVQKNFLSRLKNKKDHLDDPHAQAEDERRAGDEVNKAIEKARKRGKSR